MSYEVGKQALDFLIANSGNRRNLEVDFFGGEPLMNWDVVKRLVEMPSQFNESFASIDEVFDHYAINNKGERMPAELKAT